MALRNRFFYCTVSTVEAVTPPEFAPIVLLPIPFRVARPALLGALAIVATEAEEELQCTFAVMSCVVLSLNVPVAVNCCGAPRGTDGFAGAMAIETSEPLLMVNVVVPVTPAAETVIVDEPLRLP